MTSHEAEQMNIALVHNTKRKETIVQIVCVPILSVLNSPQAQVYLVLNNRRIHVGNMLDVAYGSDSCVIYVKPEADAIFKLAGAFT